MSNHITSNDDTVELILQSIAHCMSYALSNNLPYEPDEGTRELIYEGMEE